MLDISQKFSVYEFKLTNDFSPEAVFELAGLEEDVIFVDIDENVEPEVLKEFLIESQDFSKKPYIFNIETKSHVDVIERYYFGAYGAVSSIHGKSAVNVQI